MESDSLVLKAVICYWAQFLCLTIFSFSPQLRIVPWTQEWLIHAGWPISHLADPVLSWNRSLPGAIYTGPRSLHEGRQEPLGIILRILQELERDARLLQVTNDNVQLVLAEWAAEVSKHFNMLLPKLLPSARQNDHSKRSFILWGLGRWLTTQRRLLCKPVACLQSPKLTQGTQRKLTPWSCPLASNTCCRVYTYVGTHACVRVHSQTQNIKIKRQF